MGVKMVLSGEGSDEIFAGYLYFHKAPNADELHKETVRKVKDLYKYDCLRANKSTMAWGLEARVPFLDREFLEYAMTLDPSCKMSGNRMEKYTLRKAFDDPEQPYLPKDVLWRQKEQFSDGVGYGWIDSLKREAETLVTDLIMILPAQDSQSPPLNPRKNTCTGISSPSTSPPQVLQPLFPRTNQLPARHQQPWPGTKPGRKLQIHLVALWLGFMLRLIKRNDNEISNTSFI